MMKIKPEASERHVLAVTVDNEAGILAKIAGLFTARGYNIDSLTVADISENHSVSRITIVTHGPPAQIDQVRAQLERLVPVHKVIGLTDAWQPLRARLQAPSHHGLHLSAGIRVHDHLAGQRGGTRQFAGFRNQRANTNLALCRLGQKDTAIGLPLWPIASCHNWTFIAMIMAFASKGIPRGTGRYQRQRSKQYAQLHAGDIVASHVFHDLATKDQFLPQAVDQMQAQHVFTHRTGTGAGWTTQTRSNHATDGRFAPVGGATRWSPLAQGLGVGGRGGG